MLNSSLTFALGGPLRAPGNQRTFPGLGELLMHSTSCLSVHGSDMKVSKSWSGLASSPALLTLLTRTYLFCHFWARTWDTGCPPPQQAHQQGWGLGLCCSSPKALRQRGRGPCDSSLGTLMGELASRYRRVSTGWVWLWPTLFSTCIVGHFMVMCCSSNIDCCIYF